MRDETRDEADQKRYITRDEIDQKEYKNEYNIPGSVV